jgi:hypothetical protein
MDLMVIYKQNKKTRSGCLFLFLLIGYQSSWGASAKLVQLVKDERLSKL